VIPRVIHLTFRSLAEWRPDRIPRQTTRTGVFASTFPAGDRTLTFFRLCFAALLLPVLSVSAFAQRDLKDIPDPDPEIERKSFIVADGFEVNLFAADPAIAKPIQMNFDPQGRLWIASSEVYPQIAPGQVANDRILIVEDTDGDGRADKTSKFAEGLLIPTGVLPGDGGAYIGNSTELLHLADTDGDGKADRERVVLSGFGTEDTHHILHTLRWGPDGMLYINQSIYIHSHIETPYGVRRLNAGGIWQFRPETMRLEVFARGWVNTWGHQFDTFGQSFATDGAGGEGINYVIPGAAYPTAQGVPRIFHGLNPGSPKYCGLEIVNGRHLPDDWQGSVITNDFRGHRVCRFVLVEDGSGYAAKEQVELIKTSHVAFRPIDVAIGPDGAIYIADWYNPIIQHGEVDFRDPRRDHVHGRIWRVSYKGKKPLPKPELVKASNHELLEQLKAPEDWTRDMAKRVIKERAVQVHAIDRAQSPVAKDVWNADLAAWVQGLDANDPLHERHQLEALWVYQSLDRAEPALLKTLLEAKTPQVRAAAVRVLQHWFDRVPDGLALLAARVEDKHPRVRLEAVRVLGNIGSPQAIETALRVLEYPMDQFLDYALWLTCWETRDRWLPLVEKGEMTFPGRPNHLTFALSAAGSAQVVPRLLAVLADPETDQRRFEEALELVVARGDAGQLEQVLKLAAGDGEATRRATALSKLVAASRSRQVKPAGDLAPLNRLLIDEQPEAVRVAALEAAGLWKQAQHRDVITGFTKGDGLAVSLRRAALTALSGLGDADSVTYLRGVAASKEPFAIREAAVLGVAAHDPAGGARLAVQLLASATADDTPAGVVSAFLTLSNGPTVLTAALDGQKLPADVSILALRSIDSSGRKLPELSQALAAAGGITTGPTILSPEEMQKLVAEVQTSGDRERGERLYRRLDLSCQKCHAIGGAGGKVGPDLASIGGSAQVDYLIESMLNPNAKVKEGFHTVVVILDNGKTMSGVKVRQTDTDLILRNAEDQEIAVPLNQIEEQANGTSLMPAGLTAQLTRGELVDLVRFLSELGKVGGLTLSRDRVVRRWQMLNSSDAALFKLRRTRLSSVTEDDPAWAWTSTFSRVNGELPLSDVALVPFKGPFQTDAAGYSFVRFELEAGSAGEVDLVINSPDGLSVWLDTAPLDVQPVTRLKLTAGRHRVTFAIDRSRQQPLSAQLNDLPGSSLQIQLP